MVWGPPHWLVDRDLSWVRSTVDSALRSFSGLFYFMRALQLPIAAMPKSLHTVACKLDAYFPLCGTRYFFWLHSTLWMA